MCPKNGSVLHKSEGVGKKKPSLDPVAGVRALTKSTWSLKRCPVTLKMVALGNQKNTLDAKWRFWTLKRTHWVLIMRLWTIKNSCMEEARGREEEEGAYWSIKS